MNERTRGPVHPSRGGQGTSYDVRVWSVRAYKRQAGNTYGVRWTVGDRKPFHQTFSTRALADGFRSDLVSAARRGQPFDLECGLPFDMLASPESPSWYSHCCAFIDSKWKTSAPTSRHSLAEALACITLALLSSDQGRPSDRAVRRALCGWAYNTKARQDGPPPEELACTVAWLEAHTVSVSELS